MFENWTIKNVQITVLIQQSKFLLYKMSSPHPPVPQNLVVWQIFSLVPNTYLYLYTQYQIVIDNIVALQI